jgi:glutamate/tyrosine decarboxylase-like PLP-dependent enzyme
MEGYTTIIKQSWGLTKWLQAKLDERKHEVVEAPEGA